MWLRQLVVSQRNRCPRATQQQAAALLTSLTHQHAGWLFDAAAAPTATSQQQQPPQQQQQQYRHLSFTASQHAASTQGSSVAAAATTLSGSDLLSATAQQPGSTSSSLLADALSSSSSATTSSSSSLLSSLSTSSDAAGIGATASQLAQDTVDISSSFMAAQPMEEALMAILNPVVLSCSVWETVHSMTGLPWWASIPITTLALRTALLPLTLKAKSAGLNFVLAQQATQTATNLLDHWKQQQQLQQGSGGSSSSSGSGAGGVGQQHEQEQQQGDPLALGLGRGEALKQPNWWRLTRLYYRYYRKQHGTTSLWWWTANIAVQLNVFLAMSAALRQMAATQWPGFTSEGLWVITDLTQTSIVWGAWPKIFLGAFMPYSMAGFLLPFTCVLLYIKTVRESPLAKRSEAFKLLVDIAMVPYLIVTTGSMPQATLLYWASNSAFFLGLQKALEAPRIAAALKVPTPMLPPPQQAKEARERAELEALKAQQLVCGSEDDGFLRYLAASYLSRGMHQQAVQCLQRLTVLAPGDADAFRALGTTAAELQQWVQSARAFERAAELHAVAVDRDEHVECLLLAAKQWLNATAEARAMQRQRFDLQSSSSSSKSGQQQQQAQAVAAQGGDEEAAAAAGLSSSSSEDVAALAVQPGHQQEYINSALALLEQAVHFQAEGAADAYYLLAMAQAADGKWEPAFGSATTFWERSLALAENDQTARINAAARLLPVLNNLCQKCVSLKDYSALMTVAQLAVEVAKCGWDRQTEEQLRDTLAGAAQTAMQQGKVILGQQIKDLERQLPCGVAVRRTQK